jgi:hypothetical protein
MGSSAFTVLKSVDLPLPEGPTMLNTCPAGISRFISFSTGKDPNDFDTPSNLTIAGASSAAGLTVSVFAFI